ncbi:NAD-dependent epimerase/dehydratase family protein [Mesorhizobium temperatum]|uniref:NAD-dependent epimerase/dehydratase family protein n=1 Tax=Mesorhizobium temperatum TaxID=241416 RepID=UPI001FD95EA5|nr:NAD-dependent epimerase/dehydratase family protein [Mesorhizobium temperatum]
MLLGWSCIYPKFAAQPIWESTLMTGPLEPTNQWYAIAKIAGVMLCDAYPPNSQAVRVRRCPMSDNVGYAT